MIKVSNRDKKPLAPSELGKLYPTPKTYDEIEADTQKRQELLKTYRTRMPAFKIAFFGAMLVAAIAIYATTFEVLWLFGGMAAVFFSFGIWLILLLFAIKWLQYTANIFYEYNSASRVFWLTYIVLASAVLLTWRYGPFLSMANHLWLAIFPGAQFVATYTMAKILIKRK